MEHTNSRFWIEIKESITEHRNAGRKQLRDFGFVMAIFFGILGISPVVLRHADFRLWTLPLTLGFTSFAVFFPKGLIPLYRGWMLFGGVMGHLNSRLILGVIFFVLFTPIGLLMRLFGKDPLGLKLHREWKTYRTFPKPESKNSSLKRQF